MAGEIAYKLTADEKQAVDAVLNLARSLGHAEESAARVTAETKNLGREQEAMGRYARRAFEEAQTPAEKYSQQLRGIDQALNKGKITYDEWVAGCKKAEAAMKDVGKAGQEAFGPKALEMAKGFLGALGIEAGIAGGVKLIKEQWEAVIKLQERALEATIPVADAQRKMRGAAGFENIQQAEAVDKQIKEISKKSGVQSKDLYIDTEAAMKERHGLSREQAMGAVATAAEMFPADAAGRRQFTQAMLGVQQATGMSGPQAGGWLMAGEARAGIPAGDMTKMLNALPDEDPRQVLAVAQAMHGSGGREANSVIGLFKALEKGVPAHTSAEIETAKEQLKTDEATAAESHRKWEEETQERRIHEAAHKRTKKQHEEAAIANTRENAAESARMAGLHQTFQQRGADLHKKETETIGENFEERLDYLRAHPDRVDEVMKGAVRGKTAEKYGGQLLRGTGPTSARYRKSLASGITPAEGAAFLVNQQEIMGEGGLQIVTEAGRGLAAGTEELETANTPEAAKAAVRKTFRTNLETAGESHLSATASEMEFNRLTPRQQLGFARQTYELEAAHLRGNDNAYVDPKTGKIAGYMSHSETTPEGLKQAEAMDRLVAVMDKLMERVERNSAATDANTRASGGGQRPTLNPQRRDPGDRH